MSTKPTLIIAHDAFHKASQYERFRRALADVGIENTIIPQLPNSCVSIPTDAFAKDVETIDDIILDEMTNDRDVVILVHGYAGIAVTNALTNVQDIVGVYAPGSIKGRILGLVFIAGVVPKKGEDLASALWTGIGNWVTCEGDTCYVANPEQTLYNTFPYPEFLERISAQVTEQATESFTTPVTRASWKQYQCLYVKCNQDNAISIQDQDDMIERLNGVKHPSGKPLKVVDMDSDHWPMLCMADRLAAEVEKFLAAEVENFMGNTKRSKFGEFLFDIL